MNKAIKAISLVCLIILATYQLQAADWDNHATLWMVQDTEAELGTAFNITMYLDTPVEAFVWTVDEIQFNESSTSLANCTGYDFLNGWDTGNAEATINNDTSLITNCGSFTMSNYPNGNVSACNLTFMPLEVGILYINITSMPSVRETDNDKMTVSWNNLTIEIHPVEPAGLTATMTSDTAVSLSGFGSGNGGDYTVIRRATGSYPATPQSGTEVYNNTGSSTSDTSLSANTTYFYRAWTYNDTENIFSEDYQSDTAKTNAHPINSNPTPANDADGQELNPTISIDVYDYDDATQNMDVYFYTNESGSWVQVGSTNSSVNSGTYSQTPTNFDEWGTRYYWSVNTTDGINWDNDTYFFDTDPDDAATATNPYPADAATGVTLAPTCHVDISDDEGSSSIVVCFYTNESSTWSFKQKNTSVSDTDTVYWDFTDADTMNTKYWWRVTVDDGTNNETYGPWDFTTFNLAISNEYPNDLSTENSRPVANVSAYCAGSSMDVYIYFKNMTGTTDTWTLLDSWVDQSSDRFEVSAFDGNDLKWGNTTYTWSVNITIGPGVWVNDTYTFTTIELADGADARFDVNNDDEVKGTDLLVCYAYRDGNGDGYLYDGIYDVNNDGEIKGTDLLQIYART